jgi:hypothetical protein
MGGGRTVMDRKDFVKILTYIVTSARGCVEEPKIYGPFRLMDTASKMYYMLKDNGLIDDEEIEKIINNIDEKKFSCMTDEQEFISMMDEIIEDLVVVMEQDKE